MSGLRRIDDRTSGGEKIGATFGLHPHGINVFDMHNTTRLIQVASFTDGKSGEAGLFGDVDAFGYTGLSVQTHDFLAGSHDIAGDAPTQVESVEDEFAPKARGSILVVRGRKKEPQFLL